MLIILIISVYLLDGIIYIICVCICILIFCLKLSCLLPHHPSSSLLNAAYRLDVVLTKKDFVLANEKDLLITTHAAYYDVNDVNENKNDRCEWKRKWKMWMNTRKRNETKRNLWGYELRHDRGKNMTKSQTERQADRRTKQTKQRRKDTKHIALMENNNKQHKGRGWYGNREVTWWWECERIEDKV